MKGVQESKQCSVVSIGIIMQGNRQLESDM